MNRLGRALLADVLDAIEAEPALGSRLRELLGVSDASDWLDRERFEAAYPGLTFRQILDAGRAGRIEIGGTSRKPMVRRGEVERYLAGRRRVSPPRAMSREEEAQATLDASAARFRRETRAGSKPSPLSTSPRPSAKGGPDHESS